MAMLCESYPTPAAARNGVDALRAAGVPGRDIRLLIGCPLHDVRREPVGMFAGTVGPDAPVGTFGNLPRLRGGGRGTFAGDSARQRRGSFGDADRVVIAGYDGGAEHLSVSGDRGLRRLVAQAALADRLLDELHHGHAVVLAEVAEIAPRDAQARLEDVADAA